MAVAGPALLAVRVTSRSPAVAVRTPRHDVSARPFIVIWECTTACPLACRHCRAQAHPERDPAELTSQEAAGLMRQVADFGRPAPLFVITGGDPFQRPDLFELVHTGTRAGLRVAVSPSGTPTLTRPNLAALHQAGAVALSLSLDGSTPQIHDSFRRVEGVYGWTVAAWQAARDIGLKVQINTTVTGHNLLDLPDIVKLVHRYGAMTWSAFLLVPTGRGRELGQLTAAQVEDVLNFVYDAGAAVPAKTTEAHHFRRVVIQRRILAARGDDHVRVLGLGPLYQRLRARMRELGLDTGLRGEGGDGSGARRSRRPPMDVNAGRGFVFIARDGTVYPSGFLPQAAGNVREAPLPRIYRESPLLAGLREPDALGGRCGRCEFRASCGGSRSRAFAVTGDPLAQEPWCAYQPGSFPYQDDVRAYLPPAA
jgi:AdoMet-dependent heme synthase